MCICDPPLACSLFQKFISDATRPYFGQACFQHSDSHFRSTTDCNRAQVNDSQNLKNLTVIERLLDSWTLVRYVLKNFHHQHVTRRYFFIPQAEVNPGTLYEQVDQSGRFCRQGLDAIRVPAAREPSYWGQPHTAPSTRGQVDRVIDAVTLIFCVPSCEVTAQHLSSS